MYSSSQEESFLKACWYFSFQLSSSSSNLVALMYSSSKWSTAFSLSFFSSQKF
jgi:hypothetical protein